MTSLNSYKFLTAIEHQAFHEGLKSKIDATNPYNFKQAPHAAKAWSKGNQLAFKLNARIAVQYLNAAKHH